MSRSKRVNNTVHHQRESGKSIAQKKADEAIINRRKEEIVTLQEQQQAELRSFQSALNQFTQANLKSHSPEDLERLFQALRAAKKVLTETTQALKRLDSDLTPVKLSIDENDINESFKPAQSHNTKIKKEVKQINDQIAAAVHQAATDVAEMSVADTLKLLLPQIPEGTLQAMIDSVQQKQMALNARRQRQRAAINSSQNGDQALSDVSLAVLPLGDQNMMQISHVLASLEALEGQIEPAQLQQIRSVLEALEKDIEAYEQGELDLVSFVGMSSDNRILACHVSVYDLVHSPESVITLVAQTLFAQGAGVESLITRLTSADQVAALGQLTDGPLAVEQGNVPLDALVDRQLQQSSSQSLASASVASSSHAEGHAMPNIQEVFNAVLTVMKAQELVLSGVSLSQQNEQKNAPVRAVQQPRRLAIQVGPASGPGSSVGDIGSIVSQMIDADAAQSEKQNEFSKKLEEAQEKFNEYLKTTLINGFKSYPEDSKEKAAVETLLLKELYPAVNNLFKALKETNPEDKKAQEEALKQFKTDSQKHLKTADQVMGHGWLYRTFEVLGKLLLGALGSVGMLVATVGGRGLASQNDRAAYGNTFFKWNQTDASKKLEKASRELDEASETLQSDLEHAPQNA